MWMTRAKVEEVAIALHQPRAAVLRGSLRWRLSCGQVGRIGGDRPHPEHDLFPIVGANLHRRVHETATAFGVDVTPWLCHELCGRHPRGFPHKLAGPYGPCLDDQPIRACHASVP
jgi:hypothetical protein